MKIIFYLPLLLLCNNSYSFTKHTATDDLACASSENATTSLRPKLLATYNTTTIDTTPPVVIKINDTDVTETSFTVDWSLYEVIRGRIEWGLTSALGNQTAYESNFLTKHIQTVGGLSANAHYYYRVFGEDNAGNNYSSKIYDLTTLPPSNSCSAELINENTSIIVSTGLAITWSDAKTIEGVSDDTNGSPCALKIQKDNSGDDWGRWRIPINLAENGLTSGDVLNLSIDGNGVSGKAVFDIVPNNNAGNELLENDFGQGLGWSTFSGTFTIPVDTQELLIQLYPNQGNSAVGYALFDNLVIHKVYEASTSLAINAGGTEQSLNGTVFGTDQYAIDGVPYYNASALVSEIYKTERSGSARNFSYTIAVENGIYDVKLHFAEIYWGATDGGIGAAGKRVFDVSIEEELVLDNYDIYADVGPETPVIKTFTITVTDGTINLYFSSLAADGGIHQAKLSALEIIAKSTDTSSVWLSNGSDIYYNEGNVGIGTTIPDYALTIKGKIHAEEVIIDLSIPAPDYVFEYDYELMTLKEIEDYIKQHGHLPNIPPAEIMEKDGVDLGSFEMKLLEKIEELTLHLLKQQERRAIIAAVNKKLESKIQKLNQKLTLKK